MPESVGMRACMANLHDVLEDSTNGVRPLGPIGLLGRYAQAASTVALTLMSGFGPAAAQSVSLSSGQSWPPPGLTTVTAQGVNGAARFAKDARDVSIGPVHILDAFRAVETNKAVSVDRLKIIGLTASGIGRDGIRLRNGSDVEIANFSLRHMDSPNTGRDLPEGIALGGHQGTNIHIHDGLVQGFRWTGEGYQNGDGIAIERGYDHVTIRNVRALGNTDGGFDLKSDDTRLDDLVSDGNARSYRFWGQRTEAGKLTALNFTSAAVWVGKGATVHIKTLIARTSVAKPVLYVMGSTVVTIDACDLAGMPPGSSLVKSDGSNNQVNWGAGCQLP